MMFAFLSDRVGGRKRLLTLGDASEMPTSRAEDIAAAYRLRIAEARKSELLQARWECVDLERRELRVPRPKQGKPHVYPLSHRAMEVVNAIPRMADNPFLIPGDRKGRHLVNISKAWNRVRARAGLVDVRLHDLRRSVGSWLAMSGHSLIEIGKVLGHSSPRTTQIYARLTDDTARRALEGHADRLLSVLQASGAVDPGLPPGQA